MASSYGFTNMPLWHIPSKSLAKYKEGQLYGSLERSRPPQQKELKQSQILYLSSTTHKNSEEDRSFMQLPSHLIISFEHLWTPHSVLPTIDILHLLAFSQIDKKQKSKATLLILTKELMELFLLSLLFIQNFL